MSAEFWIRPVATIVVTACVYWFISFDHRKRTDENRNQVYGPLGMTLFFGAAGLFGTAGLGSLLIDPETWKRDDIWAVIGLFGFCVVCLFVMIDYDLRKLVWDEDRLVIKKPFRPMRTYSWDQVTRIDQIPFAEAWRIWFDDGIRFQLPWRMIGTNDLLVQAVLRDHIELKDKSLIALRDSLNDPDGPI